jgi:hypothetical protein
MAFFTTAPLNSLDAKSCFDPLGGPCNYDRDLLYFPEKRRGEYTEKMFKFSTETWLYAGCFHGFLKTRSSAARLVRPSG